MSIITKEDIQVGDTIRITREVEVEQVFTYGVQTKSGGVYAIGDEDKPVIELLDRPLPPLPLAWGSVIKVTDPETAPAVNWLLHNSDEWVSPSGARKTGSAMLSFLKQRGFTFEVIA